MAELAARVFPRGVPKPSDNRGLYVGRATDDIIDAVTRLLTLMARPEDADLLGPLVVDEILIRLLRTPIGTRVAQIGEPKSGVHRMGEAISWIRAHFAQPVTVDEMAASVRMSASSFHERFKAVTSMSPLQYQKVLRLHEARRLMLFQDMDASDACRRVGYLSPSQFSREYARFFGSAPDEGHGTPPGGRARPGRRRPIAVAAPAVLRRLAYCSLDIWFHADSAGGLGKRRVDTACTMRVMRRRNGDAERRRAAVSRVTRLLVCSLAALAAATSVGTAARAQAPAVVRVDSGELQGVVDDGVVVLQGHPLRGASRGRPAVAAAAAGGAVDGRAPGRGVRGGLHAGTVRPASGPQARPRRRLRRKIACS